MIRWLEDNPVGQALAAVAGILVVAMLLLGVIWTLPPSGSGGEPPVSKTRRGRVKVIRESGMVRRRESIPQCTMSA